jgi:hypothetical protein
MRRKSVLLAFGILLLIGGLVLGGLALLARHEPEFYVKSGVPPGPVREDQSKAFKRKMSDLFNWITNREPEWRTVITQQQINSFFEEDFLKSRVADFLLPDGVTAPRVVLEQDKARLAFRYGTPPWSTIISIDFRVWLAPKQPNVVVLELQSLHAGALPISAQSLLEQLSDALRKRSIDVTWYRHNGNPTAVLRFQPEGSRPTWQLRRLALHPGKLTIVGAAVETSPAGAQAACPKTTVPSPLGQ